MRRKGATVDGGEQRGPEGLMLRSACSLPLLLAAALVAPGSAFAADGWSPAALEREVAALTAELGRAGRPAPPLDHLGPRVELQGEVTVYYDDGEDGNARLRLVIATSRGSYRSGHAPRFGLTPRSSPFDPPDGSVPAPLRTGAGPVIRDPASASERACAGLR